MPPQVQSEALEQLPHGSLDPRRAGHQRISELTRLDAAVADACRRARMDEALRWVNAVPDDIERANIRDPSWVCGGRYERNGGSVKVLHVAASDSQGGAHRAAYRLHRALLSVGVESSMIVGQRYQEDPNVRGPLTPGSKLMSLASGRIDRLPVSLYRNRAPLAFSPGWFATGRISDSIQASDADLVHLHWIADGAMRIAELGRIRPPIVWTLHDMWPFTGGCHYALDCTKFASRCGACPQLGSARTLDLSRIGHLRKSKVYKEITDVHLVVLSRWLAEQVSRSSLMGALPRTILPNPIDCAVFRPVDQSQARQLLGLPIDRPLVMFGGVSAVDNPVKGFSKLISALHNVVAPTVELIVIGSASEDALRSLPRPYHRLGHLSDDLMLALAYSAADLVVVPSDQDNLPQVAVEALACGTPVVGFDGTGLADIVSHLEWGYLAHQGDAHDLANGINWVLAHSDRPALQRAARDSALRRYESGRVATQYSVLYQAVLERHRPGA